ncbi:hypothetical protein L204_104427 [Cryptococcus depauperatus]|nr:cytoplasmic protein [Cryptococcus depauperatus CBS 7855]
MCGLTLSIRLSEANSSNIEQNAILQAFQSSVACRGPDSQDSYVHVDTTYSGHQIEVCIYATVLGLRGDLTSQPLVGKRGVLGWNGQIFEGVDVGTENDTRVLFNMLEEGNSIDKVLSTVEGPFACIYLDLKRSTVHYQLDPLSRRSLLVYPATFPDFGLNDKSPMAILSSCCCSQAKEFGIEMRALRGGEGGEVNLKDIAFGDDGQMDLSKAIKTITDYNVKPSCSTSAFTHVTPINTTLPPLNLSDPQSLSKDPVTLGVVESFTSALRASVLKRVENIPALEKNESRVALLFSGGIDCTFLAYLIHLCLPLNEPIDLINVAFAPCPVPSGNCKTVTSNLINMYHVPDRSSGLFSVAELGRVCPGREWRFVEVDIPFEEAKRERAKVIELMYPNMTEMDLSLAFPLYFAARGLGWLTRQGERKPYTVKAKVYISGLGADEQLGGYSRHRNVFNRDGWQGLIDEIQMDITRLPSRNLSRDDRLLSSHARDARYPFLGLSFMSHLSSVPIHLKCDPRLPPGYGDKRLLRLASQHVGLIEASTRVKKAMQFGTRSSKVR